MATIEEALAYHLTHDTAVVAIAGNRGYPVLIPQDAELPAWAYQLLPGTRRERRHNARPDASRVRIQITCQAPQYSQAKALANAIRASVEAYRGPMGAAGKQVTVSECWVENDSDGDMAPEQRSRVCRLDVLIWYQ
jgi:hypothetical protein